jgi:hypothetical protein
MQSRLPPHRIDDETRHQRRVSLPHLRPLARGFRRFNLSGVAADRAAPKNQEWWGQPVFKLKYLRHKKPCQPHRTRDWQGPGADSTGERDRAASFGGLVHLAFALIARVLQIRPKACPCSLKAAAFHCMDRTRVITNWKNCLNSDDPKWRAVVRPPLPPISILARTHLLTGP